MMTQEALPKTSQNTTNALLNSKVKLNFFSLDTPLDNLYTNTFTITAWELCQTLAMMTVYDICNISLWSLSGAAVPAQAAGPGRSGWRRRQWSRLSCTGRCRSTGWCSWSRGRWRTSARSHRTGTAPHSSSRVSSPSGLLVSQWLHWTGSAGRPGTPEET